MMLEAIADQFLLVLCQLVRSKTSLIARGYQETLIQEASNRKSSCGLRKEGGNVELKGRDETRLMWKLQTSRKIGRTEIQQLEVLKLPKL